MSENPERKESEAAKEAGKPAEAGAELETAELDRTGGLPAVQKVRDAAGR